MGNQQSAGTTTTAPSSSSQNTSAEDRLRPFIAPFVRQTGTLGLSRQELDKRCQPSGLYQDCQWEDRAIRRLIADGRLAARLKGADDRRTACDQECPVCMLYYDEVNVTKCCNAMICSECFLQIRPQKGNESACPYCNKSNFSISVANKLSSEDIENRTRDEQKVIEAQIRATNNYSSGNSNSNNNSCTGAHAGLKAPSTSSSSIDKVSTVTPDTTTTTAITAGAPSTPLSSTPPTVGFGSELEKDERYQLLKLRSESFASNEGAKTPEKEREIIQSIAMTPEERRRLEEEMKAQHFHPLALQVEAEAERRRMENEREFYRNNPAGAARAQRAAVLGATGSIGGRRLRARIGGGARDWNSIVDAFERGGNGGVTSLDDLVVLEAAILLSMEEEARRSQEEGGGHGSDTDREPSSADSGRFDASRHARDGFPLVRSLFGGRDEGSGTTLAQTDITSQSTSSAASGMVRRQDSGSSGGNSLRRRARGLMGNAAFETASMMMRGISEEEQIAMAIAASLQDQNNNSSSNGNDDNNNNDVSSSQDESNSSSSDNENENHESVENAEEEIDFTSNEDTPAERSLPAPIECTDDESNQHVDSESVQERDAVSTTETGDVATDNTRYNLANQGN